MDEATRRRLPPGVRRVGRSAKRVARPFVRAARAFVGAGPRVDPFADRRDPSGPVLVPIPPIVTVPPVGDGRVTLLMPRLEMARMTGGPNTALNLVSRLAEHGVPLRILSSIGPLDERPDLVRTHIELLAGRELGDAVQLAAIGDEEPLQVAPDDVFIATAWQTAHIAEAARRRSAIGEFIYLIQDYEAGFFAHSTPFALALATYRMPYRAVFNESLIHDYFVAHQIGPFGPDSTASWTSFEPAVDRALFRPARSGPGRRRRLVFYGRPRNERNCFDMGLRALRLAVAEGALDPATWDINSVGAEVPDLDLGGGRVLRPTPWMDYAGYAEFVSASDVMLSLMISPHTSYPPLEMAAAGGRVVTNAFSVKTVERLRAISPLIDPVEADADSVAAAIVRATRAAEADDGTGEPAPTAIPGTWDEAFASAIPWLIETIGELRGAP
jgi:hypothetical protein